MNQHVTSAVSFSAQTPFKDVLAVIFPDLARLRTVDSPEEVVTFTIAKFQYTRSAATEKCSWQNRQDTRLQASKCRNFREVGM